MAHKEPVERMVFQVLQEKMANKVHLEERDQMAKREQLAILVLQDNPVFQDNVVLPA